MGKRLRQQPWPGSARRFFAAQFFTGRVIQTFGRMAKAKPKQPAESSQPALFTPEQLPAVPALIAAAQQHLHNGKTTCKDEELCEAMLTHYLTTGSLRATAKRFQVSAHTVAAVLKVYEAAGKMDALKQRLSSKFGVMIELGTDLLIEKLQEGAVQANVLPIVIGVGVEKKALLDGEATSRTETAPAAPVQLADLAAYLHQHGQTLPAIDVPSTVTIENPK